MYFAGTGQVETRASAYWRQRVQAVEPATGHTLRHDSSRPYTGREDGHGPALYVTLSPLALARLNELRLERTNR